MAHATTHLPTTFSILTPLRAALSAFGSALIRVAERNPKVRQVEALQALSDEELANRGLKRSEIARHVFSSGYWV